MGPSLGEARAVKGSSPDHNGQGLAVDVHGAPSRRPAQDDYFDFPRGDMFENQGKLNPADEYGLMGSTINEVALSYGFPVEFFLDVLTR